MSIGSEWKRPSGSVGGACVEVRRKTRLRFQSKEDSRIQIRSSRRSAIAEFDEDEWLIFVAAVKDGEYNL